MQIDEEGIGCINIGALDIEQLLPEAKERIKENAMLDENYRTICKQLVSGGNVDKEYTTHDELLC
jgi:hypothetical protein